MFDRLSDLEREYEEVLHDLSDPSTLGNQKKLLEATRRHKVLEPIVNAYRSHRSISGDLATAQEMFGDSSGDDREMLRAEIDEAETALERLEAELRVLLLPKDPNDQRNVIVEIRGAEGGEEANLFAKDLYEMYVRYCERNKWKVEVLGSDVSERGGFNEVSILLKGDGTWAHFKYEGGTHRVQRVPVTESQGRIHTSSATVMVTPEADEVEVDVNQNDLQIDVYRSSGPGGQSVNTTDSAVRITHKPTGIVVSMQDQKSQLQNRAKAMQVLRSRLLKAEQDRQAAEQSEVRRGQVGSGGRSEKIRTYNFKENRVTDHRIGLTIYKLDRVLLGELDEVVNSLIAHERSEQLQTAD
jgi:peptide chain release factor 1